MGVIKVVETKITRTFALPGKPVDVISVTAFREDNENVHFTVNREVDRRDEDGYSITLDPLVQASGGDTIKRWIALERERLNLIEQSLLADEATG